MKSVFAPEGREGRASRKERSNAVQGCCIALSRDELQGACVEAQGGGQCRGAAVGLVRTQELQHQGHETGVQVHNAHPALSLKKEWCGD